MSRADERVRAQQPVAVSCDTWTDFIDLYTRDISHGGMFVESSSAPVLYTTVTLKMRLPGDIAELSLEGEVVRVVPPERAMASGQRAGFGLKFGHLDEDTRAAISTLMQHAKTQSDSAEITLDVGDVDRKTAEPKAEPMATGDEYKLILELREEVARVKEQDDFDILELDLDCDVKEVRGAFFELTKQWHPDKFQRGGPEVKALATQIFIRIKQAYQQLSRPKVLDDIKAARVARLERARAHDRARESGVPMSTERAPSRPPTSAKTRVSAGARAPSRPGHKPEDTEASFDEPVVATAPEPQPVSTPPSAPASRQQREPDEPVSPRPAPARRTSEPPAHEPAESLEPRRPRKRRRPSPLAQQFMRRVFESAAPKATRSDQTPAPAARIRARSGKVDKDALEADARVSKAGVSLKQNRFDDAIAALEEALEFKAGHARARVLLNLARARKSADAGKVDDARSHYHAVLSLDPGNHDATRELEALADGRGSEKSKGLFSRILTREG